MVYYIDRHSLSMQCTKHHECADPVAGLAQICPVPGTRHHQQVLNISSMLASYSISEALHIASSMGIHNNWASKVTTTGHGCKVFDEILLGADSIDEPP